MGQIPRRRAGRPEEQEDPGVEGNENLWKKTPASHTGKQRWKAGWNCRLNCQHPRELRANVTTLDNRTEEASGRKVLFTTTPRMYSHLQGVSAGGHTSRCNGYSRLKAGMRVRGVGQCYLQFLAPRGSLGEESLFLSFRESSYLIGAIARRSVLSLPVTYVPCLCTWCVQLSPLRCTSALCG